MAQLIINVGAAPNDGDGDPIRTAFIKTNTNFSEVFSRAQSTPPTTLVGTPGDQAGMYAYDSTTWYFCFANYTGNSNVWGAIVESGNISTSSITNGTSIVDIPVANGNITLTVANSLISTYTVDGTEINGNVTANYFIGDGSQLTNLPGVTYGNANVADYLPTYTGDVAANVVSATGNIITDGYFIGNFAGNITGNLVVPGTNTEVLFNQSGNAGASSALLFDYGANILTVTGLANVTGKVTVNEIFCNTLANVAGNVRGGNVNTDGLITATGNITGGNVLSAGIVTAAGNVTGANVNTAGNVTGAYIIGTALDATGYVSAAGNITGGNVTTSGIVSAAGNITTAINVSAGNVFASEVISATGNVTGANFRTTGNISATGTISAAGNIAGAYIYGNGSQLTGISSAVSVTKIINGNSEISLGAVNGNGNVTINGTSNVVVFTSAGELVSGYVSATGNVYGGNVIASRTLVVNSANVVTAIENGGANATGNIGSSGGYFNTVFAQSTSALYADLAECYLADADYAPGTVLEFGGSAEVTQSNTDASPAIAGVVSTRPAYQMNSGLTGEHVVSMALVGRVPCQVQGPVRVGQMLVSAGNGHARAELQPAMGTVIGKALESFDSGTGVIEIVVGRL